MGGMPGMGGMHGMGGMPGMGARQAPSAMQKGKDVNHTLFVTLKEVYNGCTKKMRITKKVTDQSGRTMQIAVDKEIVITPGWKDGTKITYEREGDELPGVIPGDIIFTLQSRPCDGFERDGDDLIYTCSIPLSQAINGVNTTLRTLDDRQIPVRAPAVKSNTIITITGEGMPNKKKRTKGDLKVKFAINIPDLTSTERAEIARILERAESRTK